MSPAHRRIGAATITFALTACAYACLLCPSVYWLDSGELAAAGFELGLLHAPGHPLAVMVSKAFSLLPMGDIALRAGLAALFCGAAAAALVARLGAELAKKLVDSSLAAEALGVTAGLAYGTSYAAAFQAIRPEVYALSSLLTLATLTECARYCDDPHPRFLARAGLWFGLGLTNHHYLVLVGAVPPALVLAWPRRGQAGWLRAIGLGALTTALALALYLYLPLRAAHDPVLRWGHPLDLRSFYWVLSAQSFQKSATIAHGADLPLLIGAVLDQLGPLASVLGLGGLYVALRKLPRLGLALGLALATPIVARLFLAFDNGNPDAYAYLGTAVAALALAMIPLGAALLAATPRAVRGGLALVGCALVSWRAMSVLPAMSLRGFEDTRAVYSSWLAEQPRGALIVPSYFQTAFSLSYLRVVEGARPDLHVLPRHFLTHPGEPAALARTDPWLVPLLGEREVNVDALQALDHPSFVEYDLDLPEPLLGRSRVLPIPPLLSDELQTRRFVLWERVLSLHRACRMGADHSATRALEQDLREQAAGDPAQAAFVDELLAHCVARGP